MSGSDCEISGGGGGMKGSDCEISGSGAEIRTSGAGIAAGAGQNSSVPYDPNL